MSTPSLPTREKLPSRLIASLRRLHWKDVLIAVLALLFLSMSAYAFRAPLAKALARLRAGSGETVSVFNVVVDRDSRQYFDVLFDKPVGQGRVGEVLDPAPAKIYPALGGSWKWQTTNALRFQPSGGLPVASEYKVTLDPARIVHEGQVFSGETELTVKTDKFLVEEVTVLEEPALEGKGKVVFRGELRFNYAVDPKTLAPLVKVADPDKPGGTAVTLETEYNSQVVGYRTEPVQKRKEERKIELTIAASLTPAQGNVPLGEEYKKEIAVGSSTQLAVRNVETQPGPRESTLKVTFSSPVSAAVAEKYVTIEPAPGGGSNNNNKPRFAADRTELSITGEMTPGE